ncbi:MAG: sulfotransferase [Candidatus Zixiibacteriota bacterium]
MPEIMENETDFKSLVNQSIATTVAGRIKNLSFKNPILIGGCGSSGTTLLKTILDSHKNIACGPEIWFFDHPRLYQIKLEDLYRMFIEQDFSEMNEGLTTPLKTQYKDTFGLFAPNYARLFHNFAEINQMFELAENTRHFLDIFFSTYADRSGKTRWAEKTPNNVFCIEEILSFWDTAKFVHVIRDGRDVALSLKNSREYDIYTAAIRWKLATEAGIRMRGNWRYYEIRYEDLILNTEDCLHKLCGFLEEDFDPRMLNFEKAGKDNPMNYGSTPIHAKSIGKWKRPKTNPIDLKILDLALRDQLEKLDYNWNE